MNNNDRKINQSNCENEEDIESDEESENEILFRKPTVYSNYLIKKKEENNDPNI